MNNQELEKIPISPNQANGLSSVLGQLGIDPKTVIKPSIEPSDGMEVKEDLETQPEVDKPAKPSSKRSKSTFVLDIDSEAISAARHFYQVGKMGSDWYYNAHNTIQAGFASEEDRVLFAVLLAITSVQNEIYTNFIEAAVLFNAIKKDAKENLDLLTSFVYDSELKVGKGILEHPEYLNLHIFKDVKAVKLANVGAKFGNLQRLLKLYVGGQLTKDTVKNMIASSVKPTAKSFETRSPLIMRLKIANYALTLVDPTFASSKENWFNVVVDTWMFRIFYPKDLGSREKSSGEGAAKLLNKLFSSDVAYANVSRAVSELAHEAGISPHMMQAALWTGIKRTWEGESAEGSNYISAVEQMIQKYDEFWRGMKAETQNLSQIIAQLDPTMAARAIQDRRAENMRAVVARNKQKRQAQQITPQQSAALVEIVEQIYNLYKDS